MPSSKRACFDDMSFPEDLVREILSKLPSFESAARLSCVCKSWYDWIRDNQRREFGDELSSQIRSDCLMVLHEHDKYEIRTHNSEDICPVNLPQDLRLKVAGEGNGILCFQDLDQLVSLHLYNPITREYRKLPQRNGYHDHHEVFGFGFNTRNNDYNIIHICKNTLMKKVMVEIYKLSTNCWSNLDVDFGFDSEYFGRVCVYVNGSWYWLYYRSTTSIATFDIATETFCHITDGLPFKEYSDHCVLDLGLLDDSLAVCSQTWGDKITTVWVMSGCRNIDSYWTKKFTIKSSYHALELISTWVHETNIFQLNPNGELVTLLTEEEERDGKNGRRRMFKADDCRYRSVVFKPTLVSLSSGVFL